MFQFIDGVSECLNDSSKSDRTCQLMANVFKLSKRCLLINTEKNAEEIIQELKFNDKSRFSRVF